MFIDVLRGRFSCQCVGYYGMTQNLGSVIAVSVNSLCRDEFFVSVALVIDVSLIYYFIYF